MTTRRLALALLCSAILAMPGQAWAVPCCEACTGQDCGSAREAIESAHRSGEADMDDRGKAGFQSLEIWMQGDLAKKSIISALKKAAQQGYAGTAAAVQMAAAQADGENAEHAQRLRGEAVSKAVEENGLTSADEPRLAIISTTQGLKESEADNRVRLEGMANAGFADWRVHGQEHDYRKNLGEALDGCPVSIGRMLADPARHLDLDNPGHNRCLQAYFALRFVDLPPPPSPAEMETDRGREAYLKREGVIARLWDRSVAEAKAMAPFFRGRSGAGPLRKQMEDAGVPGDEVGLLVPGNPSPAQTLEHTGTALAVPDRLAQTAMLPEGKARRQALTTAIVVTQTTRDMTLTSEERTNGTLAGLLLGMVEQQQEQIAIQARQGQYSAVAPPSPRSSPPGRLAAAEDGGAVR